MVQFSKSSRKVFEEIRHLPPKIHSIYDRPPAVTIATGSESFVQQHFKEECDISNILKKFGVTGVLPHRQGFYGDVSNVPGYHEVQELRANAADHLESVYNSLPPDLMEQFDNLDDFSDFILAAEQSEIDDFFKSSTSTQAPEVKTSNIETPGVPVDPVVELTK